MISSLLPFKEFSPANRSITNKLFERFSDFGSYIFYTFEAFPHVH